MCEVNGMKELVSDVDQLVMLIGKISTKIVEEQYQLCAGVNALIGVGILRVVDAVEPVSFGIEGHAYAYGVDHSPEYLAYAESIARKIERERHEA